jgi:hypothetical protein
VGTAVVGPTMALPNAMSDNSSSSFYSSSSLL